MLMVSFAVNVVLFGAFIYVLAELSPMPEPTSPAVKYIFLTNAASISERSGR
jgi:hypothetical protein